MHSPRSDEFSNSILYSAYVEKFALTLQMVSQRYRLAQWPSPKSTDTAFVALIVIDVDSHRRSLYAAIAGLVFSPAITPHFVSCLFKI
jgi:hypothetical protein